MPLLLKNCNIFAPEPLGVKDILIEGERIALIASDLDARNPALKTEVIDFGGATVTPGLIDIHVHATGGGGEQGPTSRVPELMLTDFTLNGVTSIVGLLGTDGVSRSLENLLYKVRALEEEGMTTWMLTGNYSYPSPTMTGDVARDIALIDKVIGVKIAISDHRSSAVTGRELARLAADARVAGILAGKPGFMTMHIGSSDKLMTSLFEALDSSDVPPTNFLPTHCCRSHELISEAVRFNKMGGFIDFTADLPESVEGTAKAVAHALELGADPSRVTMSSDAGGSQPVFDERGNCISMDSVTSVTLLQELRRMVRYQDIPFETALAFFTANPAGLLQKEKLIGTIAEGGHADILAMDADYNVRDLIMRGRVAVRNGRPTIKGKFEHVELSE